MNDHAYDDGIDEAEHERHEQLFGTPDERAAMQREMAERQARIKREETLAWCAQRAETREAKPRQNTESDEVLMQANATNYWKSYIKHQLDQRDAANVRAIAQAIANEEKARQYADDDIMTIVRDVRDRFDEMDARLNELEGRISKRAPAIKCDGNARAFDLDRVRDTFDGWRH